MSMLAIWVGANFMNSIGRANARDKKVLLVWARNASAEGVRCSD